MNETFDEFMVEEATSKRFGEMGYAVGLGAHFSQGEPAEEGASFSGVLLVGLSRKAFGRSNVVIPEEAT